MGRKRAAISAKIQGANWTATFAHPLQKNSKGKPKIVWVSLGPDRKLADEKLGALNRVFLDPSVWEHLPPGTPEWLRRAWGDAPADAPHCIEPLAARVHVLEDMLAAAHAELLRLREEHAGELADKNRVIEHYLGRRFGSAPKPTLAEALKNWLAKYQGRDGEHTRIVKYDLERFVSHFDAERKLSDLAGVELEIDAWLRSLKTKPIKATDARPEIPGRAIGAGRRQQIRRHVLRFLCDSGLRMDRGAIASPRMRDVRAGRGAIRWLERAQAMALRDALSQPWRDAFEIQCGMGLRPSELPTLHAANFSPDWSRLTLARLGALTLKNGSRSIIVPAELRALIAGRAKLCAVIFPQERGQPWPTAELFCAAYRRALRIGAAAVNEAGKHPIACKVDARIGRRTCATLLLGAGVPVKHVADILGDDVETVLEHYGAVMPGTLDPSKAAL